MSNRISPKLLNNRFDLFLKAINRPHATWTREDNRNVANVGGCYLDNYNGYTIQCNVNESGGVDLPFGNTRFNARQMFDAMTFAIDAIREAQKNS